MKRNLKRIISLAAAVILILCTALPASADQAEVLPGTEEESVFPDADGISQEDMPDEDSLPDDPPQDGAGSDGPALQEEPLLKIAQVFGAEPMLSALTSTMTRWEGTSNAITFPGLGDGVVKSEMLHQVDGQLAYCIDNSLKFSEGTAVEISTAEAISKTQWANEAAFRKAALAEWYVNNECSRYSLTGYQKNWLTQILIWCLCSNNMSWNRMAENGPSKEVQDAIISGYDPWYTANGSAFDVSWHIYTCASGTNPQPVAIFSASKKTGSLSLRKVSSNTALTDSNALYSLAGAEYGVYANMDDLNSDNYRRGTLVTDGNGNSQVLKLAPGSYFVKEVKAPYGYWLDPNIYEVTIKTDSAVTVTSKEEPVNDPASITIEKRCADYGADYDVPSLEGTQFTFTFYGGHYDSEAEAERAAAAGECQKRSWVIETKKTIQNGETKFLATLNENHLVSGDEFYKKQSGEIILPLGSLLIKETKAADGYTAEDATYRTPEGTVFTGDFFQKIVSDDSGVHLEYLNTYTADDRIVRADLSLLKTDADSGNAMAGVSFRLKNMNTGEVRTFVTGADGRFSSKGSDLWFGEGEKDPSLGALSLGSYVLTELRCATNHGKKLETREFEVTSEDAGTVIELDIENESISIGTTATDKADGDKYLTPDAAVTMTDAVSYRNLTPGQTYTLVGTVMDRSTGSVLINGPKPVTVTKEFTPEQSDGTVDVEFDLYTLGMKTATLVVFEKLYECPADRIEEDSVPVAVHEDMSDEGQTVRIVSLGTTATDKADGDKYLAADSDAVITDKVEYSNLIPGTRYILKGTAMNKTTGRPVMSGGRQLVATVEFTPESTDGYVTVSFPLNTSDLKGVTIVIFEELYDVTSGNTGTPAAEHKDIYDIDQSVKVKGRLTMTTGASPSSPGGGRTSGTGVSTGDSAFPMLFIHGVILILAAASAGAVIFIRRRKL